jgi:eukaryotic-like serine/threonine-protein kinase
MAGEDRTSVRSARSAETVAVVSVPLPEPDTVEIAMGPSLSADDSFDPYGSLTGEPAEASVRTGQPLTFDADPAARYQAGPLLGRGGMGDVRLQTDVRIGRPIAMKTLRADVQWDQAIARFVREARVQGQLEHPSVVPVYDLGADGQGRIYFTMKRVRGHTLAAILDRIATGDREHAAKYTRRKLLLAFSQACLAVEYAHKRGVIHRDLKPNNLMLGDFGEVYVLDWGIAKLLTDAPDPTTPSQREPGAGRVSEAAGPNTPEATRVGELLGTPLYMAPEQMGPEGGSIDARADVFTLGTILFEILTLDRYRTTDSLPAILVDAADRKVDRPSSRARDVPPELDEACVRALDPDRERRTPSAAALAEAVDRYLEGDRDLAAAATTRRHASRRCAMR